MDRTIDQGEVSRFEKVASTWWDPDGPYRALHALNRTRIGYLKQQICFHFGLDSASIRPLAGLSILDIGCGGGLVTEPFARLGATVTGVDATAPNIDVARQHASDMGLDITYHAGAAADLIESGQSFDVVLALEVMEHVADLDAFLADCRALTKDSGGFGFSTLNKTVASLAIAKVGAEYVAGVVPKGTHDWRKFLKPKAVESALEAANFKPWDLSGYAPNPLTRQWGLSRFKGINFIGWAQATAHVRSGV